MKSIILLRRLERRPVFTQNDVVKLVNKGAPHVRTLLHRLASRVLRRVRGEASPGSSTIRIPGRIGSAWK